MALPPTYSYLEGREGCHVEDLPLMGFAYSFDDCGELAVSANHGERDESIWQPALHTRLPSSTTMLNTGIFGLHRRK